ncbi:hypothetical protein BGZ88_005419, partial [Linnemannia elongata]
IDRLFACKAVEIVIVVLPRRRVVENNLRSAEVNSDSSHPIGYKVIIVPEHSIVVARSLVTIKVKRNPHVTPSQHVTPSASKEQPCVVSPSLRPVPTTTQLLPCPACCRAFKPGKNQNCNLRRHLKIIHNISLKLHPAKSNWDSIPGGRVKNEKERQECIRRSKRLWARKHRLRHKAEVEEAASVLCMISDEV